MKNLIHKLLFVAIVVASVLSLKANAAEFNAEAGFRQQSGDSNTTGVTAKSEVGYQIGMTGNFEINGPLMFRTGLLYTQRPITIQSSSNSANEAKISLTYFDVPVTVMYKFEDYGGAYAGIIAALNLDKTYSGKGTFAGNSLTGVKSMLTPFVLGAAFKFYPNMGINIYFESGGDTSDDTKNFRAVGANFMLSFD